MATDAKRRPAISPYTTPAADKWSGGQFGRVHDVEIQRTQTDEDHHCHHGLGNRDQAAEVGHVAPGHQLGLHEPHPVQGLPDPLVGRH